MSNTPSNNPSTNNLNDDLHPQDQSNEDIISEEAHSICDENDDNKIRLVNIEFDTQKQYKLTDRFKFKIDISTTEEIKEDVKLSIYYFGSFGDPEDDQLLAEALVGPFSQGDHTFEIETDEEIKLHDLPAQSLFGLNTVLLSFSYKGVEFVRAGYVVNVTYPGVSEDLLIAEEGDEEEICTEADSGDINEEDMVSGEDEDIVEAEDNGEDVEGAEPENTNEVPVENNTETPAVVPVVVPENVPAVVPENVPAVVPENVPVVDNAAVEDLAEEEEDQLDEDELNEGENATNERPDAIFKKIESPVKESEDEFEFKEHKMKKSLIEWHFLENPIIQFFVLPPEEEEDEAKRVKVE